MPTYTLTVLDTVGIQDYIFGSNVLRENIGASELVRRATRLWPFEEVRAAGPSNVGPNLTGDLNDLDDSLQIADGNLVAEVIYAGGGNCATLFANRDAALDFAKRLSLRVLTEAPDLNLVAVHVPVDWDADALAGKMEEALRRLAIKKWKRRVSSPLLGLGTTVNCRSTGLPAVGTDGDEPSLKPPDASPRLLSAGILAKLRSLKSANQRLASYLPQFREAGLEIPHDLDHFGREAGEISYIAVVHADGNGMGARVEDLRSRLVRVEDNQRYILAMREFSCAVEEAAKRALNEISTKLLRHWDLSQAAIVGRIQSDGGKWVEVGKVNLGTKEHYRYMPFRPIVFGGDDLTFVTDGRLGLALAAAYLEAFERAVAAQKSEFLAGLKACAGISVVKAHYPFSRAYGLAEDLCRNAKRAWDRKHSAMDWHFAATGLFGMIEEIRKRQYTIPASHLGVGSVSRLKMKGRDSCLEMRPVLLRDLPGQVGGWRSWSGFSRVTTEFLIDEVWRGKRNKVIALRAALRGGPNAVAQFRAAYGLKQLPLLADGIEALQTTGWDGSGRCGYFDAVESLDFFVPLGWGEEAV